MKYPWKRSIAFLLSTALALTPIASASQALGTELRDKTTTVGPGVTVVNQSLWSDYYSDLRTEHYLDYVPGGNVSAVVTYGNYVQSLATLNSMAAKLEAQGLRVLGGINANFYNTALGTPIGLVIADGLIQSALPNYYAVGFKRDGTAVMGEPALKVTASWTETPAFIDMLIPFSVVDRSIELSALNKVRMESGYCLFTDTFYTTTLNSTPGTDVILRPLTIPKAESGEIVTPNGIPVNGRVECEVIAVRESLADKTIPAGCFVLSLAGSAPAEQQEVMSGLKVGDIVTLESQMEESWTDVVSAVSGLHLLVKDGQVAGNLPAGINPYTAIGMRADGSLVLYTIDGRKSGYSIGASYRQVASRLVELGCVSAIALDGGGSTTFGTTYADQNAFQTINRPADGTARAVSTALFLVTDAGASGELGSFYLSAENDVMLAGSSMPLGVTAVDTNGYPMEWPNGFELTCEFGSFEVVEGTLYYTAPLTGGTDTIYVASGEAKGSMKIVVADAFSSMAVQNALTGTTTTQLVMTAGEVIDLSAQGFYSKLPVTCADTEYVWSMSNAVAAVDEQGIITAGNYNGSGELTVSGGGMTVTIPVTVTGGDPFTDIAGYWGYHYIAELAELGITTGISNGDGTYSYIPNGTLNRGELIALVVRMLDIDTTAYETLELPFADVESIPVWLLPYVKTAYGVGLLSGSVVDGVLYAGVNDRVSREMAMTMIGRTLGRSLEADLSGFSDEADVSTWAVEYIRTLVALGIVNGSGTSLNPKGEILRGEIAKLITMTIAVQKAQEEVPSTEEVPSEDESIPAEDIVEPEIPESEENLPEEEPFQDAGFGEE